jgi:hypothetical protein
MHVGVIEIRTAETIIIVKTVAVETTTISVPVAAVTTRHVMSLTQAERAGSSSSFKVRAAEAASNYPG